MQINDEIKKITTEITKTIDAEKIYLFGSYAYGTPSEDSDYDFYVVIPNNSLRPIEAMKKIYEALSKTKMNTPVDVLALGLSILKREALCGHLKEKLQEKELYYRK